MPKLYAGIDEVGRGCVAGPVVACAVVLPCNYINTDIKDSKKISAGKRTKLHDLILQNALAVGIGVVCNNIIDSAGIVPATKQAMQIALSKINVEYSQVVVDAVKLSNIQCDIINPFKAEDSYQNVAAASIVAKVYRDRLMDYLHTLYGNYGWNSNKGYGTKAHLDAILNKGITPLHRVSFLTNYMPDENTDS